MGRLAILALAGLVLGSALTARADDADDKAEKYVKQLRGIASRDDNLPGKPIIGINLMAAKVTDEGLKELAGLENLQTLFLAGTAITDAGLKELAKLKNLTTLVLRSTKVTNNGVKELQKALPNCKINK